MRWWDSSALLSLLLEESATDRVDPLFTADDEVAVWWGTRVECVSGISRLQRVGRVRAARAEALLADLDRLLLPGPQVPPTDEVRETACRLLRVHDLSAADALQLAAALVWAEHRPTGMGFVCVARRLCEAAAREGFHVLPEAE